MLHFREDPVGGFSDELPLVCFFLQAKAFALGSDFPSLFEGSNLYCGVKSWDFK